MATRHTYSYKTSEKEQFHGRKPAVLTTQNSGSVISSLRSIFRHTALNSSIIADHYCFQVTVREVLLNWWVATPQTKVSFYCFIL